jgi:hypothetical protein
MRLIAWFTVMFEKAVIRETKALAGVPGDDWTTAMRLLDCCGVRATAKDTAGTAKKESVSATTANVCILFIATHYDVCSWALLLSLSTIFLKRTFG